MSEPTTQQQQQPSLPPPLTPTSSTKRNSLQCDERMTISQYIPPSPSSSAALAKAAKQQPSSSQTTSGAGKAGNVMNRRESNDEINTSKTSSEESSEDDSDSPEDSHFDAPADIALHMHNLANFLKESSKKGDIWRATALESLDVDIEYAAEQIQELSKALAFQEQVETQRAMALRYIQDPRAKQEPQSDFPASAPSAP